jgi:ketosteroid isomerase-like protein
MADAAQAQAAFSSSRHHRRTTMSNAQTVQNIYAAFFRRDVPAILETLAPDVEWEHPGTGHGVPWLEPRRGRDQVAGFFRVLAEQLEFEKFAPKTVLEVPGIVVALIELESKVKATGRRITERDEAHIWHFDERGRVSKFRHVVDTHQHVLAFRG